MNSPCNAQCNARCVGGLDPIPNSILDDLTSTSLCLLEKRNNSDSGLGLLKL